MNGIPVVENETAIAAFHDLISEEMLNPESRGLMAEWVDQIAQQNPAVMMAVNLMMEDSEPREINAALIGMAIAYRTLSAQAEVEALKRMAESPASQVAEPFAAILANFEAQSIANFEALNLGPCESCGAPDAGGMDASAKLAQHFPISPMRMGGNLFCAECSASAGHLDVDG